MTPSPAPVDTRLPPPNHASAGQLIAIMDSLIEIVDRESRLVRAGKLAEAAQLREPKQHLCSLYMTGAIQLARNAAALSGIAVPQRDALRGRHRDVHDALKSNLTVLATAHAVAEGIIRGVSDSLARRATPQGYGAAGRTTTPSRVDHRPMALSRVL